MAVLHSGFNLSLGHWAFFSCGAWWADVTAVNKITYDY